MRREIQGLRAVAVLLVVLFHLWPGRLPGGYIGVDVFFVISGFLITSLLLREVDRSGSVSLGRFWARRMRRLLPASYLVLAVSAVGVLLLEPRLVWHQFFGEILAAGLYVENWALALGSVNYLAAQNTPSPAQHYWTLSVEEQFYLVWPLLVLLALWLAARWSRGRMRRCSQCSPWGPSPASATRCGSPPTTPPGPTSPPLPGPGSSVPVRCSPSPRSSRGGPRSAAPSGGRPGARCSPPRWSSTRRPRCPAPPPSWWSSPPRR